MSEVRTTSSTGGQKGVKPERLSLIPRKGLEAISRVFAFGAEKYEAHNWRRGYEWDKSFDALLRHALAANDGETFDPESGLPHLAHAGFHLLVLLTWLEEQGEGVDNPFDTRWPAGMERAYGAGSDEEEPEIVTVGIRVDTGSSSDIPAGLGDLTEELDEPVDFGSADIAPVNPYGRPWPLDNHASPESGAGAMSIHFHGEPPAPNVVAQMVNDAINERGIRRENLRF